jgi:hypothetical protein
MYTAKRDGERGGTGDDRVKERDSFLEGEPLKILGTGVPKSLLEEVPVGLLKVKRGGTKVRRGSSRKRDGKENGEMI